LNLKNKIQIILLKIEMISDDFKINIEEIIESEFIGKNLKN
jgi:hypothetical protein